MKKIVCRLCLNILEFCSNEFEVLGTALREIWNVVMLEMNFNATKDPVVCNDCKRNLQEAYEIKMRCLATEDCLSRCKNSSDEKGKADLKIVYVSEKVDGQNYEFKVNDEICRICLNLTNIHSCLKFDRSLYNKVFENHIPGLDLHAVDGDAVCESCHESLENYARFIKYCTETERKIENYQNNSGINNYDAGIDLHRVLEYSFESCNALIKPETTNEKVFVKNDNFKSELDSVTANNIRIDEPILHTDKSTDNNVIPVKEENYDSLLDFEINSSENCIKTEIVDIKADCRDESGTSDGGIDHQKETVWWNVCEELEKIPVFQIKRSVSIDTQEISEGYAIIRKQPNNFRLTHKNVSKIKIFKCDICSFIAKHKRNLSAHKKIHKKTSDMRMHKCDICSYETKWKECLIKHMLIHKDPSSIEMFNCEFCTYRAKHKSYLRAHMVIHKQTSELRMYKCEICAYETKYKWGLVRHMIVHKDVPDIKMFQCGNCNYDATQKTCLKLHTMIHKKNSDVTVFKCDICSYETKRKKQLISHMIIHKKSSEITVFQCAICTYSAKHKSNLIVHMNIHRKPSDIRMYKCEICAYETRRNDGLNKHMLIHADASNIEMFKCQICTYSGKHKNYLKAHMIIHKQTSDIRMYKCDVCSHETKRKGCLKKHMLLHKKL